MQSPSSPTAVAVLFDPRNLWQAWAQASARAAGQGSALAREALLGALRLAGQGAAATLDGLRACGQAAERMQALTRSAQSSIETADDLPALWNAQLALFGESAQAAAALGQEAWAALARQQGALVQTALAQGGDLLERTLEAGNAAALPAVAQPAAGEPSLPWPLGTLPQAMTPPQWMQATLRTAEAFWAPLVPWAEAAAAPAEAAPAAPRARRHARRHARAAARRGGLGHARGAAAVLARRGHGAALRVRSTAAPLKRPARRSSSARCASARG